MTTALSKRHQARNERALQELIKTVPGNDRCADCGARNPGWASWSLGIFLCMRCASLHRKLGTHISKVKSLSMDSWSNEQVDSMRQKGNTNSNKTFNPQNSKPSVPLDVDEVDAVLERFIKQKYDQQLFSGGQARAPAMRTDTGNTGSTRSSEDQPPPLPPKPGKRFGFGLRSASSALPLSRHPHMSPPQSPQAPDGFGDPSIRINKQSRVFGTSVGGGGSENIEVKLAQLKDMGFGDDSRNLNVLKGHGGNIERTIESLVRLGEGSAPGSRSRTPALARSAAGSQPLPPTQPSISAGSGLSFSNDASVSQANIGSTGQQNSQSSAPSHEPQVRSFSVGNPYVNQTKLQSSNPFDALDAPVSQQQQPSNASTPLDQAFQGMQISQQPPLFPNATGPYQSQPPLMQDPRFQTMTPPIPQIPQQLSQANPYAQQGQQPNGNNSNPFYNQPQQVQPAPPNFYHQNTQPQQIFNQSYNPFGQQSVQHSQPNGYQSPQTYSPMTQQGEWGQPQPQQVQQRAFSQTHSPLVRQESFPQIQSPPIQQGGLPQSQISQIQPGGFSQGQTPQMQQGGFSQGQTPQLQQGGFSQGQTPQMQQGGFQQQTVSQNPYASLQQQLPQLQTQSQQPLFSPQPSLTDPVQYPTQAHPEAQPQQPQSYNPYQTMALQPQQTGRFDKSSILALYNYPHLAPPPMSFDSNPSQNGDAQQQQQQTPQSPGPTIKPAQRSATMPALFSASSNNPFQSAAPIAQPNGFSAASGGRPGGHVSQGSVDVGGFQNGRHSPDAFAGLSARFV